MRLFFILFPPITLDFPPICPLFISFIFSSQTFLLFSYSIHYYYAYFTILIMTSTLAVLFWLRFPIKYFLPFLFSKIKTIGQKKNSISLDNSILGSPYVNEIIPPYYDTWYFFLYKPKISKLTPFWFDYLHKFTSILLKRNKEKSQKAKKRRWKNEKNEKDIYSVKYAVHWMKFLMYWEVGRMGQCKVAGSWKDIG